MRIQIFADRHFHMPRDRKTTRKFIPENTTNREQYVSDPAQEELRAHLEKQAYQEE